jgi:hypothetical protein
MTHNAAKPKEANAAGRHTGPLPISDRRNANIDAPNPTLPDASANEYFVAPSGRELACNATRKTNNPVREARTRPENAVRLRHTGGAKRGFERNHRTQPQIREGIGSTYPAKPMSAPRISAAFLTLDTGVPSRISLLTTIDFGQVLINAETGKVRTSRSGGTDATTEPLLSAPFR